MPEPVNIKLIKTDNLQNDSAIPQSSSSAIQDATFATIGMKSLDPTALLKNVGIVAIIKEIYDISKKAYDRAENINRASWQTSEDLRNYGGANFTPNSFNDTNDIFYNRIRGESVAYK